MMVLPYWDLLQFSGLRLLLYSSQFFARLLLNRWDRYMFSYIYLPLRTGVYICACVCVCAVESRESRSSYYYWEVEKVVPVVVVGLSLGWVDWMDDGES